MREGSEERQDKPCVEKGDGITLLRLTKQVNFFFSLSAITMLFSVKLPMWFWPWHTLQWMGGNKGWEDSGSITLGWQIEQNLSGA